MNIQSLQILHPSTLKSYGKAFELIKMNFASQVRHLAYVPKVPESLGNLGRVPDLGLTFAVCLMDPVLFDGFCY